MGHPVMLACSPDSGQDPLSRLGRRDDGGAGWTRMCTRPAWTPLAKSDAGRTCPLSRRPPGVGGPLRRPTHPSVRNAHG